MIIISRNARSVIRRVAVNFKRRALKALELSKMPFYDDLKKHNDFVLALLRVL